MPQLTRQAKKFLSDAEMHQKELEQQGKAVPPAFLSDREVARKEAMQGIIPTDAGIRGPLTLAERAKNIGRDVVQFGQRALSNVIGPNLISGDLPNPYSKDPEERRRAMEALTSAGMGAFGMTFFHGTPHMFEPLKRINPAKLQKGLKGEPGYAYHATSADRLEDIFESGELKTFRPSHGTPDQTTWPDRSPERRAYFMESPEHSYQFAPEEGMPVIVRTKKTEEIFTESTGDLFSRKPIEINKLEYLGEDGKWYSLNRLREQAGQFDLSKIGTGEGAQAYGWGMYFAENPKVAHSYTNVGGGRNVIYKGKSVREAYKEFPHSVYDALREVRKTNPNANIEDAARYWDQIKDEAHVLALLSDYGENTGRFIGRSDKSQRAFYESALARGDVKFTQGNVYNVDIPDRFVDRMLDWDKPLKEQPESVRKALQPFAGKLKKDAAKAGPEWGKLSQPEYVDSMTGQDLYDALSREMGGVRKYGSGEQQWEGFVKNSEAASKKLAELGVPGIKYYDAVSRAQKEGTRNLVVFDTSIIKEVQRGK